MLPRAKSGIFTATQTHPKEFGSPTGTTEELSALNICFLFFFFQIHRPAPQSRSAATAQPTRPSLSNSRAQDRKHSASSRHSRLRAHPPLPRHLALRTSQALTELERQPQPPPSVVSHQQLRSRHRAGAGPRAESNSAKVRLGWIIWKGKENKARVND